MKTDNFYKAFYKDREIEVQAPTTYDAQKLAAAHFKARHAYDVTVVLLALGDGREVVHAPQDVTP